MAKYKPKTKCPEITTLTYILFRFMNTQTHTHTDTTQNTKWLTNTRPKTDGCLNGDKITSAPSAVAAGPHSALRQRPKSAAQKHVAPGPLRPVMMTTTTTIPIIVINRIIITIIRVDVQRPAIGHWITDTDTQTPSPRVPPPPFRPMSTDGTEHGGAAVQVNTMSQRACLTAKQPAEHNPHTHTQ